MVPQWKQNLKRTCYSVLTHRAQPCCCERFTRVMVAKGDLLFGAGRAEDVLRAWMSGLWQWDWVVGGGGSPSGRVEERSAGERSVLPRRAKRVSVAVQVRTLTNNTALAARPVRPGNFGCCFVWTIHNLSAQLGVKSFVFFFNGGPTAFANMCALPNGASSA